MLKKTSINAHICPSCQFKINTYGYPCSSLFELAMSHYERRIPLTINSENFYDRLFRQPLEYMEKKGYLISTEIDAVNIQILPNLSKPCHLLPNSPNDSGDQERRFCWC